jgi:hypothetical protein
MKKPEIVTISHTRHCPKKTSSSEKAGSNVIGARYPSQVAFPETVDAEDGAGEEEDGDDV